MRLVGWINSGCGGKWLGVCVCVCVGGCRRGSREKPPQFNSFNQMMDCVHSLLLDQWYHGRLCRKLQLIRLCLLCVAMVQYLLVLLLYNKHVFDLILILDSNRTNCALKKNYCFPSIQSGNPLTYFLCSYAKKKTIKSGKWNIKTRHLLRYKHLFTSKKIFEHVIHSRGPIPLKIQLAAYKTWPLTSWNPKWRDAIARI